MRNKAPRLSAIILATAFSGSVPAAFLVTQNGVSVGNSSFAFPDAEAVLDYSDSSDASVSATDSFVSGTVSFSGVDVGGDTSTMDLYYRADSSVTAGGQLRSISEMYLTGGFYNLGNAPYVVGDGSVTDPSGAPQWLNISSQAYMYESLTLVGDPNLTAISIQFNVDGTLVDNTALLDSNYGFARLTFEDTRVSGFPEYVYSTNTLLPFPSTANTVVTTSPIDVIGGEVDFLLTLATGVGFDFTIYDDLFFDDPSNVTDQQIQMDFFNTVTIGDISGFDINGNPVDLVSAIGSSGYQYSTVRLVTNPDPNTVPIPPVFALLGLGMLGMAYSRRNS